LKALRGQVTVIVVTHRSALVQHMDKLMVLEAGRVKHYGPVADVMQAIRRPVQNPGGAQVVMMPARAAEKVS
jgi:ABC-type protease/lipase transport system fused ATPase/permease subunit